MGGVIFDPGGKIMKSFAWGLGIKKNNEAEWLALLHGLETIDWGSILNILVFGDSRQVIINMHLGYSKGSINCKKESMTNMPPKSSPSHFVLQHT